MNGISATRKTTTATKLSWRFRAPRFVGYALAVVSVAITAVLANALIEPLKTVLTGLFFGAIFLASWFGGFGPGLVATLLSMAAMRFMPPPYSGEISQIVIIFLVGGAISCLIGRQRRDEVLLRQAREELESKVNARAAEPLEAKTSLEISQREQTERLLAESQKQNEFLAKLIRDSSQPVAVAYENGDIGLVNPAFEALTGYTAAELRVLGRPRLTPPELHAHERVYLDEMRRTGQAVRYEKEYLRKDGTRVPVELLVHIVQASEGDPEYYYAFATDITERKQAREELENKVKARTIELTEANQKLGAEVLERTRNEKELQLLNRGWRTRNALLKAVNECTDEKDLVQRVCDGMVTDGGFPFAWAGFARPEHESKIQFIACSDVIQSRLNDSSLVWGDNSAGMEFARRAIQMGKPALCARLADDPRWPVIRQWAQARGVDSLTALPLIAEDEILGVFVIYLDRAQAMSEQIADILQQGANGLAQGMAMLRAKSARLLAEAKLNATESELARVARTLTVGELTVSIAHEVNQPLAAIVTNANACARWLEAQTPDLLEARAAAQRIVRDANRAAEVISRIRALLAKGEPLRERLQINEVIREIIPLVQGEMRRREAKLEVELGKDLPLVAMDRVQIQQIIMNLMINALDAMATVTARAHVLHLSTSLDESGALLIGVQDSGIGLTEEQMDRVFDAFYTTKPHGLGMGLSICRSIVESHDGRLWATSNAGGGATFQFTLPVDKGDAQ